MAVFTDDFTGTSGDALEGRTGWTRVDGSANNGQINASNQLKTTSNTETAYQVASVGSADHYAQAVLKQVNHGCFPVCVNMQDKDNFVGVRAQAGSYQAYKRVGGSFTLLFNGSATPATDDVAKFERSGNDVNLYVNAGLDTNHTMGTDLNTIQTPGLISRFSTYDPLIDDWESDAAAVGGTTRRYSLSLTGVG